MSGPTHLRVEHLDDLLGIDVMKPRVSWRLPTGSREQKAYRLRAGRWDSGEIESDQSVLVPYSGPALNSRERISWTVKVWTDAGESDWAAPAHWEMGLLREEDWVASWISPPEDTNASTDPSHPVWYLRGEVSLPDFPQRARLYVTAQGVYEFFINGNRVGNQELTPGFTAYHSRLQVNTFDVTGLLVPGQNMLGAIVSGGWAKWAPLYRDMSLGLLAQLEAGAGRDQIQTGTGPDWKAARGEIRAADLQLGQVNDNRLKMNNWYEADTDLVAWSPVARRDLDLSRLVGPLAPPVRRVQEVHPRSITRPKPDRHIVDLGQNINGWIRITDLGPPGTELTPTHGEALNADGDVTLANVAPPTQPMPYQQDRVISAGRDGNAFEPRHATKGFRYVRFEGHPGELGVEDVTGILVHTDMRRTGWFECSNKQLNKLHEAVVWSLRGNMCEIPTDCPTRARAGWTGDLQTFIRTAAFLYDVTGHATKWLADLAADQLPDGLVRHCAPEHTPLDVQKGHGLPPGRAGSGDASVIVPWEVYKTYGDRDLLVKQWPSMQAWIEYATRKARKSRHPSQIAKRQTLAAHERYLWDTGFHWGEWNEPDMPIDFDDVQAFMKRLNGVDHGNVATAYLHHSAGMIAATAHLLGDEQAADHYRNLADATRDAWQQEYLDAEGRIAPHTQASYVRGLAFGLVPDELRAQAADHLVHLIQAAGYHPETGFLSTPYLLPVLADHGYLDVAYGVLLQQSPPSWLAMINRGATTIWEHWHATDDKRVPYAGAGLGSLNHYSKGSVASFLHRYVAGIDLLPDSPAYRRFKVEPRPGGSVAWAKAAHDSPYGRISVSWKACGALFSLDLTVPPGTTATVRLPDGQAFDARPGTWHTDCTIQDAATETNVPRDSAISSHAR